MMPRYSPHRRQAPLGGFTLIELLTVIAVIGILASIVMAMAVRQKREAVPFLCGVILLDVYKRQL